MITYSENNWLHDVQDCVNELSSNDFTLDDVYQFESRLATLHPDNHNVREKFVSSFKCCEIWDILNFLTAVIIRNAFEKDIKQFS